MGEQSLNWNDQLFVCPSADKDMTCYMCRQELVDPASSEKKLGNCHEDALRWRDVGGYFSRGVDMVSMHIVICERCKLELLGPYLRISSTKPEFNYTHRNLDKDMKCYKCHGGFVDPFNEPEKLEEKPGFCFEERFMWLQTGGHFLREAGMSAMHIILCENCKFELFGPYLRFSLTGYEFHYARREKRDDDIVLQRWKARQNKRYLLKGLKGRACDQIFLSKNVHRQI